MVPSGGDRRWEGMPPSKQENRHKAGQRLPLPRMRAAACHSIKTCRTHKISSLTTAVFPTIPIVLLPMIALLRHLVGWIIVAFQSREDLILENLALRQQLLVLHSKRPRRRLSAMQKLFWLILKKLWAGWKNPLVLVTPRTVVGWHRAVFRLYWKWLSKIGRASGRE